MKNMRIKLSFFAMHNNSLLNSSLLNMHVWLGNFFANVPSCHFSFFLSWEGFGASSIFILSTHTWSYLLFICVFVRMPCMCVCVFSVCPVCAYANHNLLTFLFCLCTGCESKSELIKKEICQNLGMENLAPKDLWPALINRFSQALNYKYNLI